MDFNPKSRAAPSGLLECQSSHPSWRTEENGRVPWRGFRSRQTAFCEPQYASAVALVMLAVSQLRYGSQNIPSEDDEDELGD